MDIYFEEQYAKLYENENEKVEIFEYKNELGRGRNIFLKRKIFSQNLKEQYFDIITPYGYGGPIFEVNDEDREKFIEEYFIEFSKYCEKNNIVSEFIRFHPLLENYKSIKNNYKVEYISDTVYMNLFSKEMILKNISSKARNMIRKAEKNNLIFKIDENWETIENFKNLYKETMIKNNANKIYYFDNDYYKKLYDYRNKIKLVNVIKENEIISTSLILVGDKILHYHLSANTEKGYKNAANNFLLYSVALWGNKNGCEKFHLGGGYGGNESSLFKFKKSMNENGVIPFYIGKKIWNEEVYKKLVEKIKLTDIERKSSYFPLYRIRI